MATENGEVLTESVLNEIEALAQTNASETYRGALLALVEEVRRLRGVAISHVEERKVSDAV